MNRILGHIICKLWGHKRGRDITGQPTRHTTALMRDESGKTVPVERVLQCPRCGATWTRKAKRKAAA